MRFAQIEGPRGVIFWVDSMRINRVQVDSKDGRPDTCFVEGIPTQFILRGLHDELPCDEPQQKIKRELIDRAAKIVFEQVENTISMSKDEWVVAYRNGLLDFVMVAGDRPYPVFHGLLVSRENQNEHIRDQ